MRWEVIGAKVEDWATSYSGEPFHALLCDPPYELGFMGKDWDRSGIAFKPDTWAALAEHLYPGAFGMAFASARGWHRLAVAIEDAGLVIHPSIFGWCYGSGFPKATRIDTQVDKAAGAERKMIGRHPAPAGNKPGGMVYQMSVSGMPDDVMVTAPATSLALAWEGHRYGLQALKPALEPIIVFQKPYRGKPVDCITATGAGALNIDGARIPGKWERSTPHRDDFRGNNFGRSGGKRIEWEPQQSHPQGRWPANLVLDKGAAERLDEISGERPVSGTARLDKPNRAGNAIFGSCKRGYQSLAPNDFGGASRFFFRYQWEELDKADPLFYCSKAGRKERDAGLDRAGVPLKVRDRCEPRPNETGWRAERMGKVLNRNHHPTVKPVRLCQWLASLLLPPPAYKPRRVLVPFAGSGSEMIGAGLAGWDVIIGIEMVQEYVDIAEARLKHWLVQPALLEV